MSHESKACRVAPSALKTSPSRSNSLRVLVSLPRKTPMLKECPSAKLSSLKQVVIVKWKRERYLHPTNRHQISAVDGRVKRLLILRSARTEWPSDMCDVVVLSLVLRVADTKSLSSILSISLSISSYLN